MAPETLKEELILLKDVLKLVSSINLRDQRRACKEIFKLIASYGDSTNEVFKVVSDLLKTGLQRQNSKTSNKLLPGIVSYIAQNGHAEKFVPYWEKSLKAFRKDCIKSKSTSFIASNFILCTILLIGPKTNVDPKLFIESISKLCSIAFVDERARKLVQKYLNRYFSSFPKEGPENLLNNLPKIEETDDLCFYFIVIQYLKRENNEDAIKNITTEIAPQFCKLLLSSKTELPLHHLDICKLILGLVDNSEMDSIYISPIEKNMLRNPETAISILRVMLESTNLNMSRHCSMLAKHISLALRNKEESIRKESLLAVNALAKTVDDGEAMYKFIKLLFDIIGGSEGKITQPGIKAILVEAIGKTIVDITPHLEIADKVCELFLPLIKTEVNDSLLNNIILAFGKWGLIAKKKLPSNVHQYLFKQSLTMKNSTPNAKCYYLKCMYDLIVEHDQNLEKEMIKIADKGTANLGNSQIVVQSLIAICILWKMGNYGNGYSDYMKQSLPNYLKSTVYLSFKTLVQAPGNLRLDISRMVESLYKHQLITDTKTFASTLTIGLLQADNKERKDHVAIIKRNVALECDDFIINILDELGEKLSEFSGDIVERTILDLCSCLVDKKLESKIAFLMNVCLSVHSDKISNCTFLWNKLLRQLNLNWNDCSEIKYIQKFTNPNELSEDWKRSVKNLALTHDKFTKEFVKESMKGLRENYVEGVEEKDVAIMNHPEDDLWDISILINEEAGDSKKNLKKENKLYSYEEQLAEIEIRREVTRKRIAEGKAINLTKKQEELKKAQMKKEKEIRDKLKAVYGEVDKACILLQQCSTSISENLIENVLESLRLHLNSLLTAKLAAACLFKLTDFLWRKKADAQKVFCRELVASGFCRLIGNRQIVDKVLSDWSSEDLFAQIRRAITYLNIECKKKSTFGLAFLVCFFDKVTADEHFLNDSEVRENICNIILSHANEEYDSPEFIANRIAYLLTKYSMPNNATIEDLTGKTIEIFVSKIFYLSEEHSLELVYTILDTIQNKHYILRKTGVICMDHLLTVIEEFAPEIMERVQARILVANFDGTEEDYAVADDDSDDESFSLQISKKYAVALAVKKLLSNHSIPEPNTNVINYAIYDLQHDQRAVRVAAANAIVDSLQTVENIATFCGDIMTTYENLCHIEPPKYDEMGRIVVPASPDLYEKRSTVIYCLYLISVNMKLDESLAMSFVDFYLNLALRDNNKIIREKVLYSAKKAIESFGQDYHLELINLVDDWIKTSEGQSDILDEQHHCAVVMLGSLGKFLDRSDQRVISILKRLITCLNTPSSVVQMSVANCLADLADALEDDLPTYIRHLLNSLFSLNAYAERVGCAYGVAALIKAYGINGWWDFEITDQVKGALSNKKCFQFRESALLLVEKCCYLLGKACGPMVSELIQYLLDCCADSNKHVREAAEDTAKAIMSNLTHTGVKLILPDILKGLTVDSWRTKASSIDMLGAVAFCAPKQLSEFLPGIVPKLIDALSDSHQKVTEAGRHALSRIGNVIKNEEIQTVVPILLDTVIEPAKHTKLCLETLASTRFQNQVDPPSLALIMPVVLRSFLDRSVQNRTMASNIVGNLFSISSKEHVHPYLESVMNGLQQTLIDPAPEVRANSAAALASVYKTVKNSSEVVSFIKWLKEMIKSENSTVDRSGAAQGISYIWSVTDDSTLERNVLTIVNVIKDYENVSPYERDGHLQIFLYLPEIIGERFEKFIPIIINPILTSLSDENEYVRDMALKCGTGIINNFYQAAIEMMLPELLSGTTDDNWRIRLASISLLGDLLYKITGISGKMTTETSNEDDSLGTEKMNTSLLVGLGIEKRDLVLAALYMSRSDVTSQVRNSATHVWKAVVSHTPKTLKEILPILFDRIIELLSADSYDKRQVAARALGDVVKKLGEKVLSQIIPILETGLDHESESKRHGVCVGLAEVVKSSNRDHLLVYADTLVPTMFKALIDPSENVRERAADMFQVLQEAIGNKAVEEILPKLTKALREETEDERALDALKQLLKVKSKVILPHLVPVLIAPPINTTALAHLAAVAGDSLTRFLPKIIPALLVVLSKEEDVSDKFDECCEVLTAPRDFQAGRAVIDDLSDECRSESLVRRAAACNLLWKYLKARKTFPMEWIDKISRIVFTLYLVPNDKVLAAATKCLSVLLDSFDIEDWSKSISLLRQNMRFVMSEAKDKEVPGFGVPRLGLVPLSGLLKKLLMTSKPDVKEGAALMLHDALRRSPTKSLLEVGQALCGSIIRLLTEKHSVTLKIPLIDCLMILMQKVSHLLKFFLSQISTAITRGLSEPNRPLRQKSVNLAMVCFPYMQKMKSLLIDTLQGLKQDDIQMRDTYILTIRYALLYCSEHMGQQNIDEIHQVMTSIMLHDSTNRHLSAGCLGVLIAKDFENQQSLLKTSIEKTLSPSSSAEERHAHILVLMTALKEGAEKIFDNDEIKSKICSAIKYAAMSSKLPVNVCGLKAVGFALYYLASNPNLTIPSGLLEVLQKTIDNDTIDVRLVIAKSIVYISTAVKDDEVLRDSLLIPFTKILLRIVKDKNSAVRCSAEVGLVRILKGLQDTKDLALSVLKRESQTVADTAEDTLNRLCEKKRKEIDNYDFLESLDHTCTL
ncbi:DgyrCDS9536 [Dimorphilus gyrociliatus]|uniref:DgyrCDS9536 n=1 Tax=Dimorphilus gyrociliatus TaxID=2664684 RepID=A0A7I8VXM7_9ANNE|nr:DgyrCDS9536 [Dimorphilus gyrociliatus]